MLREGGCCRGGGGIITGGGRSSGWCGGVRRCGGCGCRCGGSVEHDLLYGWRGRRDDDKGAVESNPFVRDGEVRLAPNVD